MKGFHRSFGFFDTNASDENEYTALGSIYFVHQDLRRVERYNYSTDEFTSAAGPAVPSDICCEGVCVYHNKCKFKTGQFGRVSRYPKCSDARGSQFP